MERPCAKTKAGPAKEDDAEVVDIVKKKEEEKKKKKENEEKRRGVEEDTPRSLKTMSPSEKVSQNKRL